MALSLSLALVRVMGFLQAPSGPLFVHIFVGGGGGVCGFGSCFISVVCVVFV